jgi:hypothetical protein
MATFRDLVDRIALDYLDNVQVVPEIKRAIRNAIKCYEGRRWWFNTTATALACSAGAQALAVPSDFLALDRLEISYSGAVIPLRPTDFASIRAMNCVSATGQPTHYSYYADAFQLALVPDSAYPVQCYYLHSLPALSADGDSNAWTNEASNLIAHEATIELILGPLKNVEDRVLQRHMLMRSAALSEMNSRNDMRLVRGLRPTSF